MLDIFKSNGYFKKTRKSEDNYRNLLHRKSSLGSVIYPVKLYLKIHVLEVISGFNFLIDYMILTFPFLS